MDVLQVCKYEEYPIKIEALECSQHYMSRVIRKPVFGVSDQVRHKPGCTATEERERFEISDLGIRGIALSV